MQLDPPARLIVLLRIGLAVDRSLYCFHGSRPRLKFRRAGQCTLSVGDVVSAQLALSPPEVVDPVGEGSARRPQRHSMPSGWPAIAPDAVQVVRALQRPAEFLIGGASPPPD